MKLMDMAFLPFFSFFWKIDGLQLITHLVKFLRKLSKIEGDKNFLKRGGRCYLFQTFDNNSPHFQRFFETITTLPLNQYF